LEAHSRGWHLLGVVGKGWQDKELLKRMQFKRAIKVPPLFGGYRYSRELQGGIGVTSKCSPNYPIIQDFRSYGESLGRVW